MKSLIRHSLLLICVSISGFFMAISAQEPVIQTENGTISGYRTGKISVFKGIPFAAPPIGNLRWKPPQAVKNWPGILKCDKFSASPMQRNPVPFKMWTEEFITPPGNLSEDCLYLNIWTPFKSAEDKLPVFVWIYGGGFSSGSAACAVYDGEEMSKKGVVFVSLNYRVGALGFLAHPGLSSESPDTVSGNYGLLDQIAALKWIRNNIETFGGDPHKVTIAGQSAGSMSVWALLASPLAKGLFQGAITQSGGILNNYINNNLAEAEKSGLNLMKKMKVSSIEELRHKSAQEIIAAGDNFGPVFDGYVIPKDIYAAFMNGKLNDCPVMAGWVTGDGSLSGEKQMKPEEYNKLAVDHFGIKSQEFLKLFPGATSEQVASSMEEMTLIQFAALTAYVYSGVSKNNVYFYQFSHIPVDKPGFPNYGAFHTSEVPFALHTLHLWKRPWHEVDFAVERTMSDYWVNFVKTGNPNCEGSPEWPAYITSSGNILEIGDQSKLLPGLYKNELKFLKEALQFEK